jgi:hypothetical protein
MGWVCRLCLKYFSELPPETEQLSFGRGVFHLFRFGDEVHELRIVRSVKHIPLHETFPRVDCSTCNPNIPV